MLVSRCGRIVRWRCFLVPCHKVANIYAFEHAYYPEARLKVTGRPNVSDKIGPKYVDDLREIGYVTKLQKLASCYVRTGTSPGLAPHALLSVQRKYWHRSMWMDRAATIAFTRLVQSLRREERRTQKQILDRG